MLIQALVQYYDVLDKNGLLVEEGGERVPIDYLIALDSEGIIKKIIPIYTEITTVKTLKNGKKKNEKTRESQYIILPERPDITSTYSYYLEHRAKYIFGLEYKDGNFIINKSTTKSFEDFRKRNLELIKGIHVPLIDAYRNYINRWNPKKEINNTIFDDDIKKNWSRYFAFCLASEPTTTNLSFNVPEIKLRVEEIKNAEKIESKIRQCAITGQEGPISKKHKKIKGISGGQSSGNILVSYNEDAFCSYGFEQSYNSNISESVMRKYSIALDCLLNGSKYLKNGKESTNKKTLGDLTILFWAADTDVLKEQIFDEMVDPNIENEDYWEEEDVEDVLDAKNTTFLIRKIIGYTNQLLLPENQLKDKKIDTNVDFYIVGIKPNGARISLKMIYRKRFGDMINNIAKFQRDIQIDNQIQPIPLKKILEELVPPKASKENKKNFDPTLASKLLESIIVGGDMPNSLFERMINRVKTDRDKKINPVRAGIIKGYLNQKSRKKKKEEIGMSLNIQNNNQAYLCGRLFAALQKTQEDASKNKLNRTIKNAYFSSAATQPAAVFPKLMMLYQHHLKRMGDRKDNQKVEWEKAAINRDKVIQAIIGKINDSFPMRLNLEEQGEFIIGYYQQYQDLFTEKEKSEIRNN